MAANADSCAATGSADRPRRQTLNSQTETKRPSTFLPAPKRLDRHLAGTHRGYVSFKPRKALLIRQDDPFRLHPRLVQGQNNRRPGPTQTQDDPASSEARAFWTAVTVTRAVSGQPRRAGGRWIAGSTAYAGERVTPGPLGWLRSLVLRPKRFWPVPSRCRRAAAPSDCARLSATGIKSSPQSDCPTAAGGRPRMLPSHTKSGALGRDRPPAGMDR